MTTKVLIVDDDPELRRGLGRRVRSLGYEVVEAADGDSAVTKARESAPDLVLFDLRRHGRDGIALLERYAQLERAGRKGHAFDAPASLWFG